MSHRRLEGMDKSLSATAPFDSARKGTYPHPSTISESERKEKKQAAPSIKRTRLSLIDEKPFGRLPCQGESDRTGFLYH